ncbi:uncharacterized protein METZ01_LOCUS292698 [marine metagenome]|uniref:Uncharacterized protein n=1 Tax=marine metagenome TaxID=408172 RepID=A0A382LSW9_9ZZZZ
MTGSIISLGTLIWTGAPIEIWSALAPITRAFSNLECSLKLNTSFPDNNLGSSLMTQL